MVDKNYMHRALELATSGLGSVSPNPMVGCVIVHDYKIIGEGWHKKFGEHHAEVNAINEVRNQDLLKESTVYVTLEPCSHQGKTPPCADLLIAKSVKRVVICNVDPNPKVAGSGIEKLKAAGIDVEVGLLEENGLELNKRFFTSMKKARPFIILKWAQTSDGFIARKNYDSKWISNTQSRQLVHKWRSEEDAILVGYQTALHDNPQLNVRDWSGSDPLRLVIDLNNSLPNNLYLFDKTQPTIAYNLKSQKSEDKLDKVIVTRQNYIEEILSDLHSKGVQSVIIEGGAATLNMFISQNLWDEARVFISEQKFKEGIDAPHLRKNIYAEQIINHDKLLLYKNY
ncbi:MAG: bifunctional diaminohydroxyphosphoribosylaminopyrimidine deaminase/5-amino-6-(5-phosphoribosylamino)uracil reductase RibD [Fulvivirga sp.]